MTTIHHAIVKKAAGKGVILTWEPGPGEACAHHPETNVRVFRAPEDDSDQALVNEAGNDALAAVLEMRDYMAERPSVRLRFEDGDFVAYNASMQDSGVGDEIARDPDLADLFETLAEQPEGEDGGEAEEDDEEASGSVVPAKYKQLYAERGDPTHCGDWLAITLNSICKLIDSETKKEITDLDRLETIANANDVSPERYGKLGVATNGWQGRFRMTVRNMLTPRVAAKGFLFVPDGADGGGEREIPAPGEWVAAHMAKKAAAAQAKAAVQKDEGAGKPTAKTQAKKAGKMDKAREDAALALAGASVRKAK